MLRKNVEPGTSFKTNSHVPDIRGIEEKLGATGIKKEYKIDFCRYLYKI